jgi:hypothetical protein
MASLVSLLVETMHFSARLSVSKNSLIDLIPQPFSEVEGSKILKFSLL